MVVYRPHRGNLDDSMAEAREFDDLEEMKEYIVEEWHGLVNYNDIHIPHCIGVDDRINWTENYYVCVDRIGSENYIEKYGSSQCIGMCAYGYRE